MVWNLDGNWTIEDNADDGAFRMIMIDDIMIDDGDDDDIDGEDNDEWW